MSNISDGVKMFVDQFRAQTDKNLKRLGEFTEQLSDLAKRYKDVCHDLDRERVAGRQLQQRADTLENKFKKLEEATMRGAFVLVLVDADADAYLFHDKHYTNDPGEGGKLAAVDLKVAVQHYLKSIDSALAGLPVLAKVFASGQGLATLLMKAGFARGREDALQVVSRFTSGFSQTDDMFDFVLVGKGKDRADYKLMGAFRQFAEIPSCQHILFACCHDNGYVRMLEKYVHTSAAVVKKVTLVKSFQTGSEFANLPFQSTTMDTAFRNSPLSHGPGPTFGATNFKSEELAAQVNGSPVVSVSHSPPPATYASRAVASQPTAAPPGINPRPLPVFGTLDKNIILINADGHRIDMVLLPRSAAVAEAFNSKTYIGGKRFCNTYQLCGSCSGSCGYLHDSLTAGEKLVMRHVLRRQKCLDRGKCRNPLCFYGHHCACPGGGKKCSFPVAMHGVDVASWREMNTATGGVSTSVGVGC